jgi:alkylated DNA repair protein alkB family protein 1
MVGAGQDSLGGHKDAMEGDLTQPIVSVSLGCKAVFLLGGTRRDEVPVAFFLRSGE